MKSIGRKINLVVSALFISGTIFAQTDVNVNLNVKHTVGDVSEFDRNKFIVLHSSLTEGDWKGEDDKMEYILNDLDAYLGRDNGSMGWNINQSNEDPARPGFADPAHIASKGKWSRETTWGKNSTHLHKYEHKSDMLVGGQYNPFWPGYSTKPHNGAAGWEIGGAKAAGDFMGHYFNEFYRNETDPVTKGQRRPKYMEIINEPLYELVSEGDNKPIDVFNYHNEVADAIRKNNADIKIGGYTTAFPYFDVDNFKRWEDRMKLFIDVCGQKMDFFSIHLYDFNKHHYNNGKAFHGPINYKGGRVEATFDMIEQYSHMKLGAVKPLYISEYGGRDHSIEWKAWSKERDWHFMKSFSPLMMSFMDRPNLIIKTIPFITNKAEWGRNSKTGLPYPWRLMRQAKEQEGESGENWVFTELIKFYELWSDVKGTRVNTLSNNPDVLVDSYIDGNTAYIILSNLNFDTEMVKLNLKGNGSNTIEAIELKHLHLKGDAPALDKQTISPANELEIKLDTEATAILKCTFAKAVDISEQQKETKYYADTYKQEISSATAQVFNIDGVTTSEFSMGVLRIGFGRAHEMSKKPIVKVNGTALKVPHNYSGDDQKLRDQFFGMIELNVPAEVLKTNNTISIQFPDNGGHISAVTLRVFNSTIKIDGIVQIDEPTSIDKVNDGNSELRAYPNPTKGSVKVDFPYQLPKAQLALYNISGSKIFSKIVSGRSCELDLSGYPKGMYVISLNIEDITINTNVLLD